MLAAALVLAFQGADLTKIAPLDATNSVVFAPPYDDAPNGSAFDASFLNVGPAGKNGRLIPKGGHFVEERTGERVNLFGTNLPGRAALPPKADAPKIAARLAKMGINVVRLHHLQNGWDPEGTVWRADRMYLETSPDALDRLDFFVAELIKRGIYVNVNLQTARVYQESMGFPKVVETMGFSKRIDKFDRKMIALQKQYAKDLIGRKNPYLGRTYAEEPGVAIVEINNENSLVGAPWEGIGAGLSNLPEPFNTELRTLWQAWLERTYGDDAKLAAAWKEPGEVGTTSLVGPKNVWTTENQSGGSVTFTPVEVPGQTATLITDVASNPGPDWHVQTHLGGLTLNNGEFYTVTFRAKGSQGGTVGISAMRDRADWHNVGLASSIALTPEEKAYSLSFRVSTAEPGTSRVGFVLGGARGRVEIKDLRIVSGRAGGGLPAGQSIAAGNVDIPTVDGTPRGNAWLAFLTATETAYSTEMRDYLRRDLGFRATNLIDSQTSWGGLTSIDRERDSAYNDTHEYWNHPNFTGGEWNPKSYTVNRQAITGGLPNLGTLQNLAVWRRFDRPFSVSEYDHPAPSDYAAEMMPLFASFATQQNWDALYTFNWEQTGAKEVNDHFTGYFDQARNPAKLAFYPLGAIIFRQRLLPPPEYAQTLMIAGRRPWEQGATPWAQWGLTKETPDFLNAQIGYAPAPSATATVVRPTGGPGTGSTVDVTDGTGGKIYKIESDRAVSIAGFTNGRTVSLRSGSVTFGDVGAGLSGTMMAPLDGKPFATSSRILLAAVGRAENSGMAWNKERNSVSDQWGQGPSRAEVVPMRVRLITEARRKVWVLDASGNRIGEVPTVYEGGETRFDIGGKSMGVLFEIANG